MELYFIKGTGECYAVRNNSSSKVILKSDQEEVEDKNEKKGIIKSLFGFLKKEGKE